MGGILLVHFKICHFDFRHPLDILPLGFRRFQVFHGGPKITFTFFHNMNVRVSPHKAIRPVCLHTVTFS